MSLSSRRPSRTDGVRAAQRQGEVGEGAATVARDGEDRHGRFGREVAGGEMRQVEAAGRRGRGGHLGGGGESPWEVALRWDSVRRTEPQPGL